MTAPPDRRLEERLTDTAETGIDASLLVPLLRLLAQGAPVSIPELAAASTRTEDEVRRALAAVPDTEYDQDGRIVGQGLTLRPTRHHFTVDGRQLFTWCALDTLMFPSVLGKPATIESTSPTSAETIRVTVAADGSVSSVYPAAAVVSLVNPEDLTSIRSALCNQVHYFTSPEDAKQWRDAHPGGEVVGVRDAHRLGSAIVASLLETPPDTDARGA